MLTRKIIITTLLVGFLNALAFAQGNSDSKNPYAGIPFKDRLFFGGDLGLSFGSVTYIRIAPIVGYNVSPKLAVGLGPSFQYWKDNRFIQEYEQTIWGANFFARYFVLPSIFLQSDFEVLNLEEVATSSGDLSSQRRVTIPVWFVGAGYSQRTPNGSGFFIGVFYDLIQDINSPYPDNIAFRMGGFISIR